MTREEFLRLAAAGYNRIPVACETLVDFDTPLSIYLKLADEANTYLLESVQGGEKWGRYSIIGLPARTVLRAYEHEVTISVDGEEIAAVPEADIDRTSAEGKASSIQFLHFPFTDEQVEAFRSPDAKITLGIGHEKYGHMAVLENSVKNALADDFD